MFSNSEDLHTRIMVLIQYSFGVDKNCISFVQCN